MSKYQKIFMENFERNNSGSNWPINFFVIASVLLGASLIFYFGLSVPYKKFLDNQIVKKEAEIGRLAVAVPQDDQERLMKFYLQLKNLQALLDSRESIASKIFPLLEKNTNKKVYYNKLEVDIPERSLNLGGVAENFEVLGQQFESFKRMFETERLSINNSERSGKGVEFNLTLILKK